MSAISCLLQFLPVPELIPIRLTNQILNLLQPHGQKGLLEGTMIHSLRALRRNCDLLLSTMDVFVKEPSLDWQVRAPRNSRLMDFRKCKRYFILAKCHETSDKDEIRRSGSFRFAFDYFLYHFCGICILYDLEVYVFNRRRKYFCVVS